MCRDPVPKLYFSKIMSPLKFRVITLLGTVEGKLHPYTMDNLCNSDTFFKIAYNSEKHY